MFLKDQNQFSFLYYFIAFRRLQSFEPQLEADMSRVGTQTGTCSDHILGELFHCPANTVKPVNPIPDYREVGGVGKKSYWKKLLKYDRNNENENSHRYFHRGDLTTCHVQHKHVSFSWVLTHRPLPGCSYASVSQDLPKGRLGENSDRSSFLSMCIIMEKQIPYTNFYSLKHTFHIGHWSVASVHDFNHRLKILM